MSMLGGRFFFLWRTSYSMWLAGAPSCHHAVVSHSWEIRQFSYYPIWSSGHYWFHYSPMFEKLKTAIGLHNFCPWHACEWCTLPHAYTHEVFRLLRICPPLSQQPSLSMKSGVGWILLQDPLTSLGVLWIELLSGYSLHEVKSVAVA